MNKPVLTIKEAADQYNVSRFVLMKWQSEGRIKLHRPNGRDYVILREELEAVIKAS